MGETDGWTAASLYAAALVTGCCILLISPITEQLASEMQHDAVQRKSVSFAVRVQFIGGGKPYNIG